MIRYAHTNLIARNWKALASFYEKVFECIPIPPDRNISGNWIDKATGLKNTQICGIHLQLPGFTKNGPTLEIFEYDEMPAKPPAAPNTPGFSHIAFAVDDVDKFADKILAHGGSKIGDSTQTHINAVGDLVFQYMTDPEGNIIEIQSWNTNSS